ncbi:MAG: hypothetical protein AB7U98_01465 [Candidatus Nitrosocosmicus sp.]
MSDKATILIEKDTRKLLSKIGRKDQTYDDVIRELIKNEIELFEQRRDDLRSSNSANQ